MTWIEVLGAVNLIIVILAFVGGYIAIRSSISKTAQEIQERLINTLTIENEALQRELRRLRRELAAMRLGFKHLGVAIEIEGNDIILTDAGKPKSTRVSTVHLDDDDKEA